MTGTQARPLADARRACFARSILSISGLGDGIAPGDMARQAAPRPSNPPSAAAPCDRPDKTNVDGTPQDTSISFDLTGRLRKHYRNLAQPTRRCAEPQTLHRGPPLVAAAAPARLPGIPANRRAKSAGGTGGPRQMSDIKLQPPAIRARRRGTTIPKRDGLARGGAFRCVLSR